MFTNPGSKIKSYAKVLFWIGAVISIIIGIVVIAGGFTGRISAGGVLLSLISGILAAAIGIILSWISVLALYGFGTLVENSDNLVRLNGGQPSGDKAAEKAQMPKIKVQVQPMSQAPAETASSSKVCPKCGEPVEEDAHFCRNCGERID